MVDIATQVPARMRAGDSISWKISNTDYPATAYTLKYYLVSDSKSLITITASADGADHLVEVDAATSADYAPGKYGFTAAMEAAGVRYPVADGVVEILPDFSAQSTGYDYRSWVETALDAIHASLAGRASKAQSSLSLGDKSVSFYSPAELMDFERSLSAAKERLDRADGTGRSQQIKVRF